MSRSVASGHGRTGEQIRLQLPKLAPHRRRREPFIYSDSYCIDGTWASCPVASPHRCAQISTEEEPRVFVVMFAKIGDLATSIVIGHARSCMVMPSSLRALLAAAAVAASPDGSNSNCANHSAGCWLHLAGENCSAGRDCGAQLVCLRGQCRQCTADSECSDSERRHDPASCLGCTRQR